MIKIISVVGARPNFVKIAPFIKAIEDYTIQHILVHTGQHYDANMSDVFFKELDIPEPDINLGIGSGSHGEQIGKTIIEFEKILIKFNPDWVVVVGDVHATISCSIIAKQLNIKVCHIEAGLRSGDLSMPEEINRIVTDRISDLLLTPDEISFNNLLLEGTPKDKIVLVGNIMIDTLKQNIHKVNNIDLEDIVNNVNFALITLHRPSTVDNILNITHILEFIINNAKEDFMFIWPMHPRAKKQLEIFGLFEKLSTSNYVIILHPVSYIKMLKLNLESSVVITDSGGLQEECCVLGTPCITIRENTERPITLLKNGGTNILVEYNMKLLQDKFNYVKNKPKKPFTPKFWDGNTAKRCIDAILTKMNLH